MFAQIKGRTRLRIGIGRGQVVRQVACTCNRSRIVSIMWCGFTDVALRVTQVGEIEPVGAGPGVGGSSGVWTPPTPPHFGAPLALVYQTHFRIPNKTIRLQANGKHTADRCLICIVWLHITVLLNCPLCLIAQVGSDQSCTSCGKPSELCVNPEGKPQFD